MEGQASASDFRDWAHLPLPAVLLVSENIKSLTDYVRFRAVCSPWCCASPSKPSKPLPPQLPWLMLPYAPHQEWIDDTADDGMRLFYDLWESKFHSLRLPETIGRMCCATYRGWLLLVADEASQLLLINPITKARVDLPPFTAPVRHIWDDDGAEPRRKVDDLFKVDYSGNFAISKVAFSSELTDPSCVVTVFVQRAKAIFFCRVGDPCWTEVVRPPFPGNEPADAAYHNGVFYLLGTNSVTFYDPSKDKHLGLLLFEQDLEGVTKYFLVGKSGLYMVTQHVIKDEEEGVAGTGDNNYVRAPRHMIELYHIDSDKRMLVKRVTDTNDHTVIFYGDRNHYLAVCADDWDVLDGGSMYMQYKSSPASGNRFGGKSFSILFAKLEDGKPRPVLLGFGEELPIFPPAAAMWFQPSFV